MSRVATFSLQNVVVSSMQRAQQKLAVSQNQLATGKKAPDFATLGAGAIPSLSAHSLLARQEAQATVRSQINTKMSIQDSAMNDIASTAGDLKNQLLTVIGTGQSDGLQSTIEGAFQQFRWAINMNDGGEALFGGSQTDSDPFTPQSLQALVGVNEADVFRNDQVKVSGHVADGVDMQFGVLASDIGTDIFNAFKTLAEASTIASTPTDDQKAAMQVAISQIDKGLSQLQGINAENGRKMAQLDELEDRAGQRTVLMQDIINQHEDADLSQIAIDISQRKTMLEASYSVFSQLSKLGLINYLN